MPMTEGPHLDRLREALAVEARAQRALLAGEPSAPSDFHEAARLYRASWELAPPGSYGRLIGMLKAAVLAGDATEEAAFARAQLDPSAESPPARYALAIAALVQGDDATARSAAEGMRAGSGAFGRAADAIAALADGDATAFSRAVEAIADDFAHRDEHLTGVPIADTALMLARLALPRGLVAGAP